MIHWLRFPLNITWYITAKCNLRCTHCYLTDYTTQAPLDRILPLIDYVASKGVRGIALLGGEPLVRSDLEQIVTAIAVRGVLVKVGTNGTLATPERACSLVNAGCTAFQVSLEGHSPDLSDPVRGQGTFNRIVSGVRNLKNAGAWVSLALTVSRQNASSIREIHRFACEVQVDELKLSAFVPVGTGRHSMTNFLLTREIVLEVRRELEELQKTYPQPPIDSIFLPPKEPRRETCGSCVSTFGCGAGTTNLIINADLSLSACDILVEEDRATIPINEPEDIEKVWNAHPLFRKWRGLDPTASTPTIPHFREVHRQACHVAFTTYGENLFRR